MCIHLDAPTPATNGTLTPGTTTTSGTERGDVFSPAIKETYFETSSNELPLCANKDAIDDAPTDVHENMISIISHGPAAKALLDRSATHVAAILTRFTNLVQLCMAPEEDAATLETQASRSLQIEVGWQGLVSVLLWGLNECEADNCP